VFGDTPLHLAAEKGHLDIVGYLTEKGANVNVKRRYGLTPLHFAAQSGHLDIVKYLVDEKGADINVRDGHGKAPVYFAVCNGHLDIIKYLVDIKGAYFGTNYSLYVAVQNGYLDIVKYLVDEKGADFNVMEGYYSDTPLHFAAKNGHLDVVKYLVDEKGANVNAENTSWYTPLHMAAWGGYLNVVKYLVEKGADINAKDKGNRTPLDLTNTRDVIKYLQGLNTHRSRRDVFHDSWTSNSIVNWVKGLLPSTELPALLTSKTYNNSTTTIAPEVNATVVNNTIILGILTAGLFNKTQHKHSIHENLLSPREQLISNVDNASRFLEASLRKGEEEGWGIPSTDVDEVEISGNKTEVWKGNK
jgi:ankyrin repeat protein